METHDVPGTGKKKFVTRVRYPEGSDPPLWEFGVESRETEEPFRIGFGWSWRIPFTTVAVVWGTWVDDGGDEHERLTAALRGRSLSDGADEIKDWAS